MRTIACLALMMGAQLHGAASRTTLQPADLPAGSFFSYGVAASGNLLAVGAPLFRTNLVLGPGSVYIFQKSSGGSWVQQAKLQAPQPQWDDNFGMSVALDGNTLVVGAPRAAGGAGQVHEYRLINGSWQLQQTLTPAANDRLFGTVVTLNRSTLAVGSGAANTSSVYVFTRSQTAWGTPVRILPPDSTALSFGGAIAVQDNTMVIGAPRAAIGDVMRGRAYVYGKRNGQWLMDASLTAPVSPNTYLFGWSVAVDNGRVAVGAPLGDVSGAVFVYRLSNNGWTPAFSLDALAAGAGLGANFGQAVALNANTLAVGAPAATVGSVQTFTITDTTWTKTAQWSADSGGTQALFGQNVLLPDGNSIVVASPGWSTSTQAFLGAVDVFSR